MSRGICRTVGPNDKNPPNSSWNCLITTVWQIFQYKSPRNAIRENGYVNLLASIYFRVFLLFRFTENRNYVNMLKTFLVKSLCYTIVRRILTVNLRWRTEPTASSSISWSWLKMAIPCSRWLASWNGNVKTSVLAVPWPSSRTTTW